MSTDTKEVAPFTPTTLTVAELIRSTWLSFKPPQCSEVETILINRENELKIELEKLRKDNARLNEAHDLMEKKHGLTESDLEKLWKENVRLKEDHDLMEKKHGLAELAKLKIQSELNEKLKKYAQMFQELEKKNSIISAKKRKSKEKLGALIADLYDEKNIAEEKLRILLVADKEKSQTISEFRSQINVLECEKIELEENLGKLIQELDVEKKMAEEKIQDLEREKHEMKRLIEESNDEEKEKSGILSEFSEIIRSLESEILRRDKVLSGFGVKMLNLGDLKQNVKGFDSRAPDFTGEANVAELLNKDSQLHPKAEGFNKLNPQLGSESDDDLPARVSNKKVEKKKIERDYLKRKRSESEGEEDFQKNKWSCIADMNSDLKQDPQLCLNAVCALHRYRSTFMKGSIDNSKGLAKYLINGDPEKRLNMSVLEVREKHPELLQSCEFLAVELYNNQLFEIYRNKLDPFFPS